MGSNEKAGQPAAHPMRRKTDLNARHLSLKWVASQGAILCILAISAAWFLHRAETIENGERLVLRGESLAELVAYAVGPTLTADDTPRLLKIMVNAAREGNLQAAALILPVGQVIAHTDLANADSRVDPLARDSGVFDTASFAAARRLFGDSEGTIVLRPVVGVEGTIGTVVLLLAASPPGSLNADAVKYFLPAGLLLLALLIVGHGTLRRAGRTNSVFVQRLSVALDPSTGQQPDPQQTTDDVDADQTPQASMEATVDRVNALAKLKDELVIKTQLVDYEKKRMSLILDAFPDGLVVFNSVYELIFVNRRAMKLLGLAGRRDDVRNLQEIPGVLDLVKNAEKVGQVLLTEPFVEGDQRILCTRVPLMDSGSQSVHTLLALRDVTAQRAAQRTQAEFLSQISHELKAPLNTVITFVEELAENPELSPEERREFCNILTHETNRMAQLISNLLQLSRIQLGNLSVRFRFVKTASLIREQAESLRVQAERRGLRYSAHVPDNLPPMRGDKDLLGVAINNLISNAIKYTPQGGTITVEVEDDSNGFAIQVIDTGIGIAAEDQENIFGRFFRVDSEEVQAQNGSGLGLAIVSEIVEVHGGEISVTSELGSGSCFRVWLPAREVSERPDLVETST